MMSSDAAFTDHFASVADQYARFRPGYPFALFDFLADHSPDTGLAWDCGTGTGIAALPLAERFDTVVATDASAAQLAHAPSHPRITYRMAREGHSGLADGAASLVTVAQAAHWFDLDAFYREVDRVLKPGGLLAMWCYGVMSIDEQVDAILARFEHERVGPHWPAERRHVDAGYRTLPFPYERVETPSFAMEAMLTRTALLGYLGSWSAVGRYRATTGLDPIRELEGELLASWPDERSMRVRWPLTVLAGRWRDRSPHAGKQSGILR